MISKNNPDLRYQVSAHQDTTAYLPEYRIILWFFFSKASWMGDVKLVSNLSSLWYWVRTYRLKSAPIILFVSLVRAWFTPFHTFQLLSIAVFLTAIFSHWSDVYSGPFTPHRHSPLLRVVLFNYQPCRWPTHVNAFIITENIRLMLESQLLAPKQCHNWRCPQECAWGKAKGWPQLFKLLKLLYTTGICWLLYISWSQILSM